MGQQTEPPAAGGAPKRRSFPFWKSNRSRDLKMSVEGTLKAPRLGGIIIDCSNAN